MTTTPLRTELGARPPTALLRTCSVVLWSVLLFETSVFVWGIDRGFCITDEGFFLAEMSRTSEWRLSLFGDVCRALCLGQVESVQPGRIARLVVTAAAAAAFGWGWARWATAVLPAHAAAWLRPVRTVPTALVASLAAWGYYPQSISYNTVTMAGCLVAGGGMLAHLAAAVEPACAAGRRRLSTAGWTLAPSAAAAVWVLPAKAPSAAVLLIASGAVAFVRPSGAHRLAAPAWWSAGVAAGVAGVWSFVCTPGEWWRSTMNLSRELTANDHGPKRLIDLQWAGVSGTLEMFVQIHGTSLLLLAGALAVLRYGSAWRGRRALAASIGAAAAAAQFVGGSGWESVRDVRTSVAHLMFGLVSVVLCGVLGSPAPAHPPGSADRSRTPRTQGLGVMLLLPIVGMAGTDLTIDYWFLQYGAPWVAVLVTATVAVLCIRPGPTAVAAAVSATVLLSGVQAVHGFVLRPYRVTGESGGLLSLTTTVESPPRLRGLRLDPEQARYFRELEAVVSDGGRAPPPLIAVHDMPGVVYALGARAAGSTWMFRRRSGANTKSLLAEPPAELRRAWILRSTKRAPEDPAFLRDAGLRFPDGYSLAARVEDPYYGGHVEVWRPASD